MSKSINNKDAELKKLCDDTITSFLTFRKNVESLKVINPMVVGDLPTEVWHCAHETEQECFNMAVLADENTKKLK